MNTINISVDLDALIEFYGEDARFWGNISLAPLDVIEFCTFEGAEWKATSNLPLNNIIEMYSDQTYCFNFSVKHKKSIESTDIDANILFKMVYTKQETAISTINNIFFEPTSEDIGELEPLAFNGKIAELKVNRLNQGENADDSIWQARIKTKEVLPEAIIIRYAITFSFNYGGVTRYCQIDPLIRTSSERPKL